MARLSCSVFAKKNIQNQGIIYIFIQDVFSLAQTFRSYKYLITKQLDSIE